MTDVAIRRASSAILLSFLMMAGRPLLPPKSFESVLEQIQRELELELIVATLTHDRISLV